MSNNGGVEHRSRRIATHHDSIMYGGRGILVEVSSRALFSKVAITTGRFMLYN